MPLNMLRASAPVLFSELANRFFQQPACLKTRSVNSPALTKETSEGAGKGLLRSFHSLAAASNALNQESLSVSSSLLLPYQARLQSSYARCLGVSAERRAASACSPKMTRSRRNSLRAMTASSQNDNQFVTSLTTLLFATLMPGPRTPASLSRPSPSLLL